MSFYRIYILNAQERIARSLECDFTADIDGLAHAEAAREGYYAAEVWAGDRLVGRLGGEFSFTQAFDAGPSVRITSGY